MRLRSVLWATGLVACARVAAPPPPVAPAPNIEPARAAPPVTPADEWRCGGELVPPTGWQQETAFADASWPDARERAAAAAASKLERRLCGDDEATCPALRSRITTWKTGSNGKELCAMAVVKAADHQAWLETGRTIGKLDADLGRAAEELVPKAVRGKRITIDRLVDLGIPGGPRADWLRARLERALAGKAELIAAPRGWAGDGLPKGVDATIRGELVVRMEGQIRKVEAGLRTLSGATSPLKVLASAQVSFPASAAPAPGGDAAPAPPEASQGLSIHIDSHRGGSLCAGETTQVWLRSEGDAAVRVLDLYGSEALLVWPDEESASGLVKGGVNVALGGKEGFVAVPVPGSEAERFIAIAAPNEAGLGRFAAVKGTCRMPAAVARELHEGRGLPAGVKVATDGYRLVSGPACGAPVPEEKRKAQAAAVAALPECRVR